jgi:hypothetical protein
MLSVSHYAKEYTEPRLEDDGIQDTEAIEDEIDHDAEGTPTED